MYHIGTITAWIIIFINVKPEGFNLACACAGIHLLGTIAYEINQLTTKLKEQKESDARGLNNTLSAIGMDIVQ